MQLLLSLFEDRAPEPLRRIAVTTNQRVEYRNLLNALNLYDRCLGAHPTHICTGWYNREPLVPDQLIEGFNGMGVVFHVRSPPPAIPALSDHENEATSFLQVQSDLGERQTHGLVAHTHGLACKRPALGHALDVSSEDQGGRELASFQFNPQARPFDPSRPPIETQPEFVQDLFVLWDQVAWSWQDEPRALHVLTFFVDHRFPHRRCDQGRTVYLYDDFVNWEQQCLRTWSDLNEPLLGHEFHIVQPNPPWMQPRHAACLVIVQAPSEELVSPLITTVEGNQQPQLHSQSAISVPEHIRLADVLERLILFHRCLGQAATHTCQAWYGRIPLRPQGFIPGRSGYGIVLRIRPRPPPNVALVEHDEPVLLQIEPSLRTYPPQRHAAAEQTHDQYSDIEAPSPPVASTPQCIDFSEIIRAFDLHVDSHFLLPGFDLETASLHPQSFDWLSPWWSAELGGEELWIYYDGSFCKTDDGPSTCAGAAAAAFVKQQGTWYFAGALAANVPTSSSYTAELAAAAIAIKFTHDILKLFGAHGFPMPEVHHLYDSITVGNQASGRWQFKSDPNLGGLVRSLNLLVSHRFQVCFHDWHVRGHHGDPGNELVDALARTAAKGTDVGQTGSWIQRIMTPTFAHQAAWFWLLFNPSLAPYWHGTQLCIPPSGTQPDTRVLPAGLADPGKDSHPLLEHAEVHLRLLSCNVLSLKSSRNNQEQWAGVAGPARQAALLQQLHDLRCTIFGFQETRLQKLHAAVDEHYLLFKSAATHHGHGGLLAGFAKNMAYGTISSGPHKGRKLYFKDEHISVIHGDPRTLLLRVDAPCLKFILTVGHAPHSAQPPEAVQSWWESLWSAIPTCYRSWPLLLFVDANTQVGADIDVHVGGHAAGKFEERAEFFQHFLQKAHVFLPATFDQYHQGSSDTWTHSGGHQRRIDFIGVPLQWSLSKCQSFNEESFDPTLLRSDHEAVSVILDFPAVGSVQPQIHHTVRGGLAEADVEAILYATRAGIPFHLDVHSHAALLQNQLERAMQRSQASIPKRPRKTTMTSATWQLVQQKRDCRVQLAEATKLQKLTTLEQVFDAWRHGQAHLPDHYRRLRVHQDHIVAVLLFQFRQMGRDVARALGRDDRAFFAGLLSEGAQFLHPGQVRRLWQVIRRSIPKFRDRRTGLTPHKLVQLEPQWIPYLSQLEVGDATPVADLLSHCVAGQTSRQGEVPREVSYKDLPTLQQFESALRKTQSGRSTGFDLVPSAVFHDFPTHMAEIYYSLLLKIFLWGQEPIQFKGGKMAMIPKKPETSSVEHFRGILLLPSIAKRIHALVREQMIQKFLPTRDEGQLGGLPEQQVLFGSQAVRTATQILAAHHFSVGVLFIDLSNAFHRLVREWVIGIQDSEDFQQVIEALQCVSSHDEFYTRVADLRGLLSTLGCNPLLLRLLTDIHADTWFRLHHGPAVRTRRGTRPGSPLADAIFHVLMGAITCSLRQWISEQQDYVSLLEEAAIEAPMVVWSDDLAVVWATRSAAELPHALGQVIAVIDKKFADYGFSLNYNKGKTEAVVTFRGPGAASMRKQFLLCDRPGIEIATQRGTSDWLHFAATYKHLGTIYSSSHTLEQELRHRVGAAKGAFRQLAKPILCNQSFPRALRLRLFDSLIVSRLFFGLGAWATPSQRLMQKLRVTYIEMLKKVLRLRHQPEEHLSHRDILRAAHVGDVRARLAIDRLAYARRVFQVGPPFLQALLATEHMAHDESWLHGLFADLKWLRDLLPGELPPDCDCVLTDLVSLWQQPRFPWKSLLKKAWRRYLQQEYIMLDIEKMHLGVYRTLKAAGSLFTPDPEWTMRDAKEMLYACHCGRRFSTPQGLALHKWKAHEEHAPEHTFIDGPVCPACLTFLWSSHRVRLHLMYMPRDGTPNPCFQYLQQIGYQTVPASVPLPTELRGAARLDALRVAGPFDHRPHKLLTALDHVRSQIESCHADLVIGARPPDEIAEGARLGEALTCCTRMWCAKFCEHHDLQRMPSLLDWWFSLPTSYGHDLDDWAEMVFLLWGQHEFGDIVAEQMDGEIEYILDELYAEIAALLPRPQAEAKLTFLQAKLRNLEADYSGAPVPHRPVRRGNANDAERRRTMQQVPHAYENQGPWLADLLQVTWHQLPEDRQVPIFVGPNGHRTIIVAHLFSGRRRDGDLHAHLQLWSQRSGIQVKVLSMDTAVSVHYGNLDHRSSAWDMLSQLYAAGWIACTLLGTPCETFSEARFQLPPEGQKWPRPLRSATRIYGLEDLTARELRQAGVGSLFYLQGLQVLAHHICQGGYYISEHPAPPRDPDRPTVWRAPLTRLLRQHPEVKLCVIGQWEWHADSVKPTGLLNLRLPQMIRSMRSVPGMATDEPTNVTIGKDASGKFKTAGLKEYPPKLSEAFTKAFTDQLSDDLRRGHWRALSIPEAHNELFQWVEHTTQAGEKVSSLTSWLPDFQG